ncbi:DNA-directed RNA polymerase subunit beta' [bacterium]|nr:DNA-directed RNA polymerase subunit beta' [bacterium]
MAILSSIKTIALEDRQKKRKSFKLSSIALKIASPEEILSWSSGEVLRPETINYRSQKPERDGLFCQKIFGPVKDWECACGKYKKIRYRGIVCERCGVEVTRSIVRRERMGHIKLASPVVHIWFFKGVPSHIGLLLGLSVQSLEKIIYFASFVITEVDEKIKKETLEKLKAEFKERKTQIKKDEKLSKKEKEEEIQKITTAYRETEKEIKGIVLKRLLSELEYHDLSLKYGHFFTAKMGAEAILDLLSKLDLRKLIADLEKEKKKTTNDSQRKRITKVIKVASSFLKNKIKPEWMVLRVIPVIPPDLRPLVQLDGGRFASSDLNDLYRRVINRNNRLKHLMELNAPEVILRNEKRMLQEAVDALLDNEMRSSKTTSASSGQARPLKSLADILRGKQGRFRQNLLGKRVDYSGRSVIVVNPNLKLDECGLPKVMALELYKPFIASRLIKEGIVHNVRSANHMVDDKREEVFPILEEIVKDSYVMLNRAPTLHRISIQAFRPVLVEGKAIQIHPLVCPAFNADFDGDMMAVFLPISEKACQEVRDLILSTNNLLKPANGEAIVTPPKDMVWGAYWMTSLKPADDKERPSSLKIFSSPEEAFFAYETGKIDIRQLIKVKLEQDDDKVTETSVGRLIFSQIIPKELYNLSEVVDKRKLAEIVRLCYEKYGKEKTSEVLDKIKEVTLFYLTRSGLSIGISDFPGISKKYDFIRQGEKKVQEIEKLFEQGLLTEDERYRQVINVWLEVGDEIAKICRQSLEPKHTTLSMITSGARGSWSQLTQMIGMKGIVASPTGRLIELPIISSYKEGLSVLEYFISTHGSRKGIADTALRTPAAGYLTRRLVDVAQDVLVTEEDCHDEQGLKITREECKEMSLRWSERIFGRVLAKDVIDPKTKKKIASKGDMVDRKLALEIDQVDPDEVWIRSVLTCKTRRGVCAKCYGYDLANLKPVKLGATVGVVAAQSIGEPGMQLILRTFHTGGVAGEDIVQGLPRVEELFEARPPKRKAILARYPGVVSEIDEKNKEIKLEYDIKQRQEIQVPEGYSVKVRDSQLVFPGDVLAQKGKDVEERIVAKIKAKVKLEDKKIILVSDEKRTEVYDIAGYSPWVEKGQKIQPGDVLTNGHLDLHEYYSLKGKLDTQKYILREIQYVYSSYGQTINPKHIEVIVRQMFSRLLVVDGGDTDLLPGEIVPRAYFEEMNEEALKKNKNAQLAKGRELLLGISRVSLSTDSWLAAASFQETSRVLINAAVTGKKDYFRGLKENVIVGQLIPVNIQPKKDKEEKTKKEQKKK